MDFLSAAEWKIFLSDEVPIDFDLGTGYMYQDIRPFYGRASGRTGKRQAVALYYRRDLPAPLILARGSGYLADKILASAELADVPIIKDSTVSGMLIHLDVGQIIPESCYEITAELFRFVQKIDRKGR